MPNENHNLAKVSALAARWNVSARMIRTYVAEYGLTPEPGSKPVAFDLAKAEVWRAAFVPGRQGGKKPRHRGDPPGTDRFEDAEGGEHESDGERCDEGDSPREKANRYKLQYQREQARKLQLANDLKAGTLVEHAVVVDATARLLGDVRQQLEAIPHRLAPDIAASALVDQQAVDAIRKELAARGTDEPKIEALCGAMTRIGLEGDIRRQIEASVRQALRALSEMKENPN